MESTHKPFHVTPLLTVHVQEEKMEEPPAMAVAVVGVGDEKKRRLLIGARGKWKKKERDGQVDEEKMWPGISVKG